MRKPCQTPQLSVHVCIHLIPVARDVYPRKLSAYSHSSIRVSLSGGHVVGSVARPGDGSNSMRGARPVRQWGPHRTTDNRGDDTVMVDGGVGDSDDSGLRSIDLATLSGVLRVCDVELLLLDGNGPRRLSLRACMKRPCSAASAVDSTVVAVSCCRRTGRCWAICTQRMKR